MKTKRNLLLVGLLIALLLPAAARAQVAYLQYATTNGQVTITNYIGPSGASVVVPDTINGLPVVAIAPYTFSHGYVNTAPMLSGIIMSGTNLTTIGDYACHDQESATIVLPPNLISIGEYAFLNCFQYQTNLTLPGTVQSIGQEAFKYAMFTSVVIPKSVTNISGGAIDYTEQLKAIYFQGGPPANMASILFLGDTNATIYVPTGTTGWPSVSPSDFSSPFGGGPQAIAPYSMVINGGFDDTGGFDGWTLDGNGNGQPQIKGPNVYSGPDAAFFTEPPGGYNLLYQTIPTQPGATYVLSFAVNGMAVNASCYLAISWNGQQLDGDFFPPGWTVHQFTVTASSSNTEVLFLIGGGNSAVNTIAIDSVTVTPVTVAPTLTITKAGTTAIISWGPSWSGYTLQTNATLAPGTWNNYTGAVVNNSTTNSAAKGTVFYRLKQE